MAAALRRESWSRGTSVHQGDVMKRVEPVTLGRLRETFVDDEWDQSRVDEVEEVLKHRWIHLVDPDSRWG